VKRIELDFAGLKVEFCDRERAMHQVEGLAERGTRFPLVVFGPEGCGKTAWLRQAIEVLKERGFNVVYFNPTREEFFAEVGIKSLEDMALELLRKAASINALASLVSSVIYIAREAVKLGRKKVAVIVDDTFQYVSDKEAAFAVKGLLELIEHPPESYERVVAIAATSEGLSRREIGRHLWAKIVPMWNMSRRGFEELYEKLPGPKPRLEDVWAVVGGNPRILAQLYESGWREDFVLAQLVDSKRLDAFTSSLGDDEKRYLLEAIEDPDTLLTRERIPLLDKLVELNLIVDTIPDRRQELWIDEPPPERDLELGIGKRMAWQSPLHREAVKRALKKP